MHAENKESEPTPKPPTGDMKLVAYLSPDGKHRSPSKLANLSFYSIVGTWFMTDVIAHQSIRDFFKETPSKWREISEADGVVSIFGKTFAQIVDPNHWKSTISRIGLAAGFYLAADLTKEAIERKAFQNRFGNSKTFTPDVLEKIKHTEAKENKATQITEASHDGVLSANEKVHSPNL